MFDSIVPPYSEESEKATIGAVIMDGSQYDACSAILKPEDFFLLRHRYIWEALATLRKAKTLIDYITVCQTLKDSKRLDEIGGAAYITQLNNSAPSSHLARVYAGLVERDSIRRQMLASAQEIMKLALDSTIPAEEALTQGAHSIEGIRPPTMRDKTPSLQDVMSQMYDEFEKRIEEGVSEKGITTGFTRLNEILGGWRKKRLHIVGGRPGMGKTQYMLDAALKAARSKKPDGSPVNVLFVTLEMVNNELGERLISHDSQLSTRRILETDVTAAERKAIIAAMGDLSNVPLFLEDRITELTPKVLKELCLDFRADHKTLDLVVVDYVQLMAPDVPNPRNRQQEVSSISRSLKLIPRELDVPFIVGCQLNRESEGTNNNSNAKVKRTIKREPVIADLRESGSLEQDADVIIFPFFPNYYLNPEMKEGDYKIRVAKQRNGPLGTQNAYANFAKMKFTEQNEEGYKPF